MTVSEFIVSELIRYGVTDTFGIPGGVILKLLSAMKNAEPALTPHLTHHEQTAGFAALGYAQAGGKLGAAYATRGPGITNMVTCIAEAYQESVPVLFITAHSARTSGAPRFMNNQELDIVSCVSGFTKFAANIDSLSDVREILGKAITAAVSGRKGPVLLDIAASLFAADMPGSDHIETYAADDKLTENSRRAANETKKKLISSERPVLLIGDGIRHTVPKERLHHIVKSLGIPVLSSRGSQDILGGSPYYFGYVGSHGVRYSNFILSKADLIISVGNRMAFPLTSESFAPVIKNAEVIRIDIDENEFERHIPGELTFTCDGGDFLETLYEQEVCFSHGDSWLGKCRYLKEELINEDCPLQVERLAGFIRSRSGVSYVCDVGNNEFYFSRAYEKSGSGDCVYCSRSFGTLGSALGRAIGVHYATGGDVICVTGDQGLQYNIQELRYISHWQLPITIVLLNNSCSEMIRDHEKTALGGMSIHVDEKSGYSTPDFRKISESYGIIYTSDDKAAIASKNKTLFYEIRFDSENGLTPSLPKGKPCQDMSPYLERSRYERLDNI
ncbi:MAG: thiamine pyrophosphate-binding protein [Huintestinicola sp.]|uniref:thiamine pyrophosphate-binding protein n=1 Tax=Huintestinicola sp. TaxID=2981661 RepID=UPI003F0342E5